MTIMRDSNGEEYELQFFDKEGIMLDPNRLLDGDWLKDPRVYRTEHFVVSDTLSSIRNYPTVTQNNLAGRCLGCNLKGSFYVNNGKEYCGLCNEFFDTYALMKKQVKPVDALKHKLKIANKMRDDARRKGDFVLTHKLENEIMGLEYKFAKQVEEEAIKTTKVNVYNEKVRRALSNRNPDHGF